MRRHSSGVASAPSSDMLWNVSAHSPGVFNDERTISASWQLPHVRCTSALPGPSGNCACVAAIIVSHGTASATPILPILPCPSLRNAERIQRAVVRAEVHATVRDRDPREVIPLMHLVAARPQLLTGARVERVDDGARALRGANRRIELQT